MPEFISNFRGLLNKLGMGEEVVMLRMTGCPNGCARPYMAELALVGDGVESYQLWTGGSPVLTRVSSTYADRVKWATMDQSLEPLLVNWRDNRSTPKEAFGDFCHRVGVKALSEFSAAYAPAV